MNLNQALSIPYVRGAETVFDDTRGQWIRRFEYVELDGCTVEAVDTLCGLRDLEVARVARIAELFACGRPVPVPRAPLQSAEPLLVLGRLGLDIDPGLLELDEADAPGSAAFCEFARLVAEQSTASPSPLHT